MPLARQLERLTKGINRESIIVHYFCRIGDLPPSSNSLYAVQTLRNGFEALQVETSNFRLIARVSLMWIVRLPYGAPYTFVVFVELLLILGPVTILRTPRYLPNSRCRLISYAVNSGLSPTRCRAVVTIQNVRRAHSQ